MRWQGRRQSGNVEDRRGVPVRGMAAGGGVGVLLIALVVMFLGGDPGAVLQQAAGPANGPGRAARPANPAEVELKGFVSVVLADTEDVWRDLFQVELGQAYRDPKLVLYSEAVESACGFAQSAVGPFYCPADERVYIDLTFCDDLRTRFEAPGDFAVAYVLAHEVGHHVQNQLGMTDQVHSQRGRVSKEKENQLSVRLELQADFLAGVWAHHAQRTKNILEAGDLEEALRAASAVGDDRLQMQAQGRVVPDSFTHGSAQQRARWFGLGVKTGDLKQMDRLFTMPYDQL
ncbi:MAG: zinc metallopeptidase [Pirellulales bacterium]|nr:zinc metallopeptidase [Pirellulales bacterium]